MKAASRQSGKGASSQIKRPHWANSKHDMKTNEMKNNTDNTTGIDLLAKLEAEIANTIAAYKSLLEQCRKLADTMGYNDDYVIGKVMPKTAADRTNTGRIEVWFQETKDDTVANMLQLEAERAKDREREKLLASLNLTADQKALLGFG